MVRKSALLYDLTHPRTSQSSLPIIVRTYSLSKEELACMQRSSRILAVKESHLSKEARVLEALTEQPVDSKSRAFQIRNFRKKELFQIWSTNMVVDRPYNLKPCKSHPWSRMRKASISQGIITPAAPWKAQLQPFALTNALRLPLNMMWLPQPAVVWISNINNSRIRAR